MAAITKQIKKLDVQNFLSFLQNASTSGGQHVIDIKDGKMYSKVTVEKSFIKYATADLSMIGDFSEFADGAYRYYMLDLDKLIKAFEIAASYNKQQVDVKCACWKIDDEDPYIRIEKIWIVGSVKLQVSAKDGSFQFNYVKDSKWKEYTSAPTMAEFDLNAEDIGNLKKVFSYLTMEDSKAPGAQGAHMHLETKPEAAVRFTEEDEKLFDWKHTNNVIINPEMKATTLAFNSPGTLLKFFNEKLYRVHIKLYNEVYLLVAIPAGDSSRTIVISLVNLTA